MSTDIKLSKAQINKLIKSGGALKSILARFLPTLIKPAISLGKNILAPLNKIVKALEDSDVLMKGITKTLKNDIKKGGALPLIPMLLGTLGASLLTGRGLFRAGNQGQGMFRAGQKDLKGFVPGIICQN